MLFEAFRPCEDVLSPLPGVEGVEQVEVRRRLGRGGERRDLRGPWSHRQRLELPGPGAKSIAQSIRCLSGTFWVKTATVVIEVCP